MEEELKFNQLENKKKINYFELIQKQSEKEQNELLKQLSEKIIHLKET